MRMAVTISAGISITRTDVETLRYSFYQWERFGRLAFGASARNTVCHIRTAKKIVTRLAWTGLRRSVGDVVRLWLPVELVRNARVCLRVIRASARASRGRRFILNTGRSLF